MQTTILTFDTRGTRESIDSYGERALRFILEHKMLGFLDDEAIQQAERVSTIVVAAREIAPAALANLHEARLMMAREQTRRSDRRKAFLASLMDGAPKAPQAAPQAAGEPSIEQVKDVLRAFLGGDSEPEGGAKVPAGPIPPRIPPSDGVALNLPGNGRPLKRF